MTSSQLHKLLTTVALGLAASLLLSSCGEMKFESSPATEAQPIMKGPELALEEGKEAIEQAYAAAKEMNKREGNDLRLIFDYDEIPDPTGGHTEEWASVDASGNVVSIHGTPYQLHFTQTGEDEAWQLFFVDTDTGSRVELDVCVSTQKLPFSIAVSGKEESRPAVTRLYLAPDGKSLVVDAFCGTDHEESGPLCISWREGAPIVESPIRTMEWVTRMPGSESDEYFVGWKGTRPVTTHRRG